jgi:hypothetical protein
LLYVILLKVGQNDNEFKNTQDKDKQLHQVEVHIEQERKNVEETFEKMPEELKKGEEGEEKMEVEEEGDKKELDDQKREIVPEEVMEEELREPSVEDNDQKEPDLETLAEVDLVIKPQPAKDLHDEGLEQQGPGTIEEGGVKAAEQPQEEGGVQDAEQPEEEEGVEVAEQPKEEEAVGGPEEQPGGNVNAVEQAEFERGVVRAEDLGGEGGVNAVDKAQEEGGVNDEEKGDDNIEKKGGLNAEQPGEAALNPETEEAGLKEKNEDVELNQRPEELKNTEEENKSQGLGHKVLEDGKQQENDMDDDEAPSIGPKARALRGKDREKQLGKLREKLVSGERPGIPVLEDDYDKVKGRKKFIIFLRENESAQDVIDKLSSINKSCFHIEEVGEVDEHGELWIKLSKQPTRWELQDYDVHIWDTPWPQQLSDIQKNFRPRMKIKTVTSQKQKRVRKIEGQRIMATSSTMSGTTSEEDQSSSKSFASKMRVCHPEKDEVARQKEELEQKQKAIDSLKGECEGLIEHGWALQQILRSLLNKKETKKLRLLNKDSDLFTELTTYQSTIEMTYYPEELQERRRLAEEEVATIKRTLPKKDNEEEDDEDVAKKKIKIM